MSVDSVAHPRHVRYIDKSRDYYKAVGYDEPYRWAANDEAPFTPLSKPLSDLRIGVVTTSGLFDGKGEPVLPKRSFAAPTSPLPTAMFTDDLSWDHDATHTDDLGSYLPLVALEAEVAAGRLGSVSPRFYGIPTAYSQRKTLKDADRIATWCAEDDVDVVMLVPL